MMATCPISDEQAALLAEGSMTDPAISARPRPYYDAMRAGDPVHYDEKLGMYLVSRYEDILAIQADPATFSVQHGYSEQYSKGFMAEFQEILKRDGQGFFPDAIMSDPPYHTRIRKLLDSAFTGHRVKELEPRITAAVADLIESMADKGAADAVNDFAIPLTIRIITEQLGLEDVEPKSIQRWSSAVTAQIGRMQNREQMVENAKQVCALQNYLIGIMRKREVEPQEDMISDLMHAKIDETEGAALSFAEAVSLVRAMLIAGNETTATALGNLFHILATKPDIAKLLQDSVDDDRLLNRFVEELLRYEPPVRGLSRMTTREVELGGKLLPAHAHLLLMYASANDQEDVFPAPRDFDINRPNIGRHLSFGGGVHRCIGLALARMEIKVAAREIVRRMDNIRLAIPESEIAYLPSVATHTIERLPITFTRRA
jgi:cytochrome P450